MSELNIAGKLAKKFVDSPLTPLLAIAIFIFGLVAVFSTPREENPQINVPAANVIISYPGATAEEVENIIVEPLSRKLKEMTGVKHIYGVANNDMGVISVRFEIGEDKEDSYLKLYDRVMQNMDLLPKGVLPPLFKPIDIDEVPIVTYALSSKKFDDAQLYRIAQSIQSEISTIKDVSVVGILGGHKKQFNIILDPLKLSTLSLTPLDIHNALNHTNQSISLGDLEGKSYALSVRVNSFISNIMELENLVISSHEGRVVYLKDVAQIQEGVDIQNKHETYTFLAQANEQKVLNAKLERLNQVTLFISKKRGSNAVVVADAIKEKVKSLEKQLPKGVDFVLSRDDGHKANEAVNELIFHLWISIVIIVILLILMLGWRESLIVAFVIPLILGLTLFAGMMVDQTINRITLFALILALGLLVDDAIVVIENIHRHFSIAKKEKKEAVIYATNEIGGSTNIATFAVILAFLPMFFVTGMMGPYMAPIPFNVPIAMLFSLLVAYIFTPWLAYKFLPHHHKKTETFDLKQTKTYKLYNAFVRPMLEERKKRYAFFIVVLFLFVLSLAMPVLELVKFKMLPGANKNTFNITLDLPNGSAIQKTKECVACIEQQLLKEEEVSDFETFIGLGGVIDFNGLLRGNSMKKGDNVAEIRVNLKEFSKRKESSANFVSRFRKSLSTCKINNANIKLVEDPPGPPVQATMVAQIFGGDKDGREKIAVWIKQIFEDTQGVVDIDTTFKNAIVEYQIVPNRLKASIAGVSIDEIVNVLKSGFEGSVVSVAHIPSEKEQVQIYLRYLDQYRQDLAILEKIFLISKTTGKKVPLSELSDIRVVQKGVPIYSKDVKETTLVTSEMDMRGSVYALLDIFSTLKSNSLQNYDISYDGNPRLNLHVKDKITNLEYEIVWGGEWELTFDVFRDLGSAFGVAILLIYLLLISYYGSFVTPGIVASAVPLTFIGVFFGHAFFDLITPTFFSATSMIGFIALSGVVIRNSLLLVDFMKQKIEEGKDINEAVIEGGATRFRPILLTALAIILASFVIVADPVWQGLAISLIFGVAVSTAMTLVVVPLLYWRRVRKKMGIR